MPVPAVAWSLCDEVTGLVLTDLPVTGDSVVCNLAQDNTATFTLAVLDTTCPPDWPSLLTPLNRMLVLTINDAPVQAWWIDEAPTVGDSTVTFTGHTLEACASTMNVPDISGSYDDAYAAYLMCTQAVSFEGATTTTTLPSLAARFGFTVTYTPTGKVSDFDYSSTETNTVLAGLQSLMAQGRIEFRFRIQWTDNTKRAFTKTIEIGPRIGSARPDAVFDLDINGNGSVASYQKASSGRGATLAIGSATLTGGANATTDPQLATALLVPFSSGGPGYPTVELRQTYENLSDSVDLDATLLARTRATLKRVSLAAPTWQFKLKQDGLQPGYDFDAGDTVPYQIDPRPTDPTGGMGMARLLGYTLSLSDWSCTPTLWPDPDDN